jgi:hypothetical protein
MTKLCSKRIYRIVTYLLIAGRVDPGRTAIARQRPIYMIPPHQIRHPLQGVGAIKHLSATAVTSRNNREMLLTAFAVRSVRGCTTMTLI